jgi:hypothetical protein
VAANAAFVVGTPVTTVAPGRVELSFDPVEGHEVAAMRHLAIGTITILVGWFHLDLIGMAIITE